MKNGDVNYLKLRLAKDEIKNVLKGWFFHMTQDKISGDMSLESLKCVSEYTMAINWREELGDINYSRISNIDLGASLVNNIILKPGQVFSLRKILGDATIERGFGAGPVVKNGKTVTTIGGGLCLVSSILFNVVLLSDLEILEKFNHSTDLWGEDRFVGLGLDATYVYGIKDLKFKNNKNGNIVVQMGVNHDERYLWCKILTASDEDVRVTVESKVLEEILPEEIVEGKEFRKGWKVETRRYSRRGGSNQLTYKSKEVYNPFYID